MLADGGGSATARYSPSRTQHRKHRKAVEAEAMNSSRAELTARDLGLTEDNGAEEEEALDGASPHHWLPSV